MSAGAIAVKVSNETSENPYLTTGVVDWFNPVKGYGFVKCDKTDEKIFVYHTNILMEGFRYLDIGQMVECLAVKTEKGWSGMNVKITTKEGTPE